MAKPRAVIDVVGAEADAHQLLEQVRFLVAALGRAKASHRRTTELLLDAAQSASGQIQRFFPACFTKSLERIRRVDQVVRVLQHALTSDQRRLQSLRMMDVVEAETTFYAQPAVIAGTIAAQHAHDP